MNFDLKEDAKKRIEVHFDAALEKVYNHKRFVPSLVSECIEGKRNDISSFNNKEKQGIQHFANILYYLSFKNSRRASKHGMAREFVKELEKKLKIPETLISQKRMQTSKQSNEFREKEENNSKNNVTNYSIFINSYEDFVTYLAEKTVPQFLDELGEIGDIKKVEEIIENYIEEEYLPGQPQRDSFAILLEKLKVNFN